MNNFNINKIIIRKNVVEFECNFDGEWCNLLENKNMFIKYNENINLNLVPESILIIPLLCNILPIAWVFNLNIILNDLDSVFERSIYKIREGYSKMYPYINFQGNLTINNIIDNSKDIKGNINKSAVLFSGGVDAFNTLISNIKENPELITIFGSDVSLNDIEGINKITHKNLGVANQLNLKYNSIYSNFRECLNDKNLTEYVRDKWNLEWWHDFQHGIALLGLTAPLAYHNDYKTIYIASSFTKEYFGKYTCASDPLIDNNFMHSNTITIHDGYEFNRQDKIHNICEFIKKHNQTFEIRVCWISNGGNNCCQCEKCYRTILGIMVENENPINYGFNITNKQKVIMFKVLKTFLPYDNGHNNSRYMPIQKKYIEYGNINPELEWLRTIKISSKKINIIYKFKKILYKLVYKVKI